MKKLLLLLFFLLGFFLLVWEKGGGPIVSQNGIAVNQLADDLMAMYDTNEDGMLSVNEESFLRKEGNSVTEVISRGLLFTDADASGNADGAVTNAELMSYLEGFDTNSDGEITSYQNIFRSLFRGKSEWGKFDERYGERFKYDG